MENNDYYIHCSLAMDIKNGILVQDKNKYDDPKLFNLSEEWVTKAQSRYRLAKKREYEEELQQLYKLREEWTDILRRRIRTGTDGYSIARREIEDIQRKIYKTTRKTEWLSMPRSQASSIDIPHAKQIPIDTIFDVLPNGFFVVNPLREERSPSNSFYLNRQKNRWQDFATGEYGDLLDLIMKRDKCTLVEAYNKVCNIS